VKSLIQKFVDFEMTHNGFVHLSFFQEQNVCLRIEIANPIKGLTQNLKNSTCGLCTPLLGISRWMQRKTLRAELQLADHQCNIHCENICEADDAE